MKAYNIVTYSGDHYLYISSTDREYTPEEFFREFLPDEFYCWKDEHEPFSYTSFYEANIDDRGKISTVDYYIDTTKMEKDRLYFSDEFNDFIKYDMDVAYTPDVPIYLERDTTIYYDISRSSEDGDEIADDYMADVIYVMLSLWPDYASSRFEINCGIINAVDTSSLGEKYDTEEGTAMYGFSRKDGEPFTIAELKRDFENSELDFEEM